MAVSAPQTLSRFNIFRNMSDGRAVRILAYSLVIGLAVRAVVSVFLTYHVDFNYWILTSENLTAGEGLYGMPGYFYTPVWGFVLAVLSNLANLFGVPY